MLVKNDHNVILCVIVPSIHLDSTQQDRRTQETEQLLVKNTKKNATGCATLTSYIVKKLNTRLA